MPRPKRKRIQYYDESDESDAYVTEIKKRPREQKRKIYYEEDDEIDGVPYEPQSPTEEEEEQEEDDIYKTQKKFKKQLKTPDNSKKN